MRFSQLNLVSYNINFIRTSPSSTIKFSLGTSKFWVNLFMEQSHRRRIETSCLGRDKAREVRQLEKKLKLWSSAHRYAIVATYKLMQDACLLCVTFFPSGKRNYATYQLLCGLLLSKLNNYVYENIFYQFII